MASRLVSTSLYRRSILRLRIQTTHQRSTQLSFSHLVASSPLLLADDPARRRRHHRFLSVWSKESATAPVDTPKSRRWMAVPPANAVHLAIGSVYVYSMWTPGMTHALGVVAAAGGDWSHGDVLPVFSASAVMLGLTTASLGSWVERVGPRQAALAGSLLWSFALLTTSAGVHFHSLPLVYTGWGLLGGIGWGLMYLAPVTTVMKWFPDRRGLATGLALSAFGAGAAIAPAFIQSLFDFYATAPDFIGPLMTGTLSDGVVLETLKDGSQVVAANSPLGEPGTPVVVATETDVAKLHLSTGAGAYVLGTGDTGTAKAMASLGVAYGVLGTLGARFMSLPHPDWTPNGPLQQKEEPDKPMEHFDVGLPVDYVTKSTRQYPLLWLSVFGNATGGLALLTSSKLMLTDIWTGIAPELANAAFATAYVSALGVGMAAGRFGWAAISDYLGRRNTYAVFGLGIPILGLSPALTHWAVHADTSLVPMLAAFCGGSALAITFYGGVFSVLPAYIADLFGQKHAGAIHGKLLTAWAVSAVVGPMGLAYLRSQAVTKAIDDLLVQVEDPTLFLQAFGCSLDDSSTIQTLVDAQTLTIGRLMELVPAGTIDPTPFLYDSSCYAAASLMAMSFGANLLIQPLNVHAKLEELQAQGQKV